MNSGNPRFRWSAVVLALLVGLAGGAAVVSWAWHGSYPVFGAGPGASSAAATAPDADVHVTSFPDSFAPVIQPALKGVVNISSSKVIKRSRNLPIAPFLNDPFFRQFFGNQFPQFQTPRTEREKSLGSGVIVRPDGIILTNNHVVAGADDVKVYLSDKRELPAKVIGTDPRTDIAVLKIDATGLPALTLGNSSKIEVGDIVFAIGDPFGVGETVTMGIVSAKGRSGFGIEHYENFIQTDAAINPGNSGGALINTRGQVIGVNTAIISGSGGSNGIGFAIPIDMARHVMNQILEHGKVIRGYLGVVIQQVTPAIAKAFGLPQAEGALVADVTPGSPAAKAGLEKGDVIVKLNGQPVSDFNDFSLRIAETPPGSVVHLEVFRNAKKLDVAVTLAEFPEKTQQASSTEEKGGPMQGVEVETLNADIANQLGLPPSTFGVVVSAVAPDSPAADAGLRRGDVIQEVNHRRVSNVADYESALRAGGNQSVLLLINRGGTTLYTVISTE
jgi:serine protease Do